MRQLEPFTLSKTKQRETIIQKELERLLLKAKKGGNTQDERIRLETLRRIKTHLNTQGGTQKMLEWLYSKYGNKDEKNLYIFIDYLVILLDEKKFSGEQTADFIEEKIREKTGRGKGARPVLPIPLSNILSRFNASYVKEK